METSSFEFTTAEIKIKIIWVTGKSTIARIQRMRLSE
jgi:hypothetical protein